MQAFEGLLEDLKHTETHSGGGHVFESTRLKVQRAFLQIMNSTRFRMKYIEESMQQLLFRLALQCAECLGDFYEQQMEQGTENKAEEMFRIVAKKMTDEAFGQNRVSVIHAQDRLRAFYRKNPDLCVKAVNEDGCMLQYATFDLQDNYRVVMSAIRSSGGVALLYASTRLKDDFDIVMASVTEDGWNLSIAGPGMKNNETVVRKAVETCNDVLGYASQYVQFVLSCEVQRRNIRGPRCE